MSIRLPELVYTGLEEAAGLNGHRTITEALTAAALLYIESTLDDETAVEELLKRRDSLRNHLAAIAATPATN